MPSVATRTAYEAIQRRATTDRDRRAASYTSPTAILTATSTTVSPAAIVVAAHSRIYTDGASVSISATTISSLGYATEYALYYDDITLSSTAPTILASTDIGLAQAGAGNGRHPLGVITTPSSTGAAVVGGGSYPPGGAPGGEIP